MSRGSEITTLWFPGDMEQTPVLSREMLEKAAEGHSLSGSTPHPSKGHRVDVLLLLRLGLVKHWGYWADEIQQANVGNDCGILWSSSDLDRTPGRPHPQREAAAAPILTISWLPHVSLKQTLSSYSFSKEIANIIHPPFIFPFLLGCEEFSNSGAAHPSL